VSVIANSNSASGAKTENDASNDGRGDCVQPLSQNGFDRRICNPADWSIRIYNPIGRICFGLQILITYYIQTFGLQIRIDGKMTTKTLAKAVNIFAKKYPAYHSVCLIDTDEKRIKALKLFEIADVWGNLQFF
jgi:hypothetical protein